MSKPEETEPGSETAEILLLDRGLGWFTSGLNSLGTLGTPVSAAPGAGQNL